MKKYSALLACYLLFACGDRSVDLGEGFRYLRLDGGAWAISDSANTLVVYPNVVRFKVLGSIVAGERTDLKVNKKFFELDKHLSAKLGYFIFDMKTRELVQGLNKTELHDALRA